MRAILSATGAVFALLYAIAFAVAYYQYMKHAGHFLADAPIMAVALPYTLSMLKVFGSVDLSGDDILEVLEAALFCMALAYIVGAILGKLARGAVRVARRR
jgi:hypothetical protein